MPIVLDTSRAPLFITDVSGVLTDEEYAAHLEDCTEKIIRTGRIYAYVYDGTHIVKMTSTQRGMQSDWLNEHRASVSRLNQGCGFVFPSVFTRGLLTAVHWVAPPPYPYTVVAERETAIAWCIQKLAAAGRPVIQHSAQG